MRLGQGLVLGADQRIGRIGMEERVHEEGIAWLVKADCHIGPQAFTQHLHMQQWAPLMPLHFQS